MAVSIADLFVSVSADVSGAQAGLTALDKQLSSTANSFERAAPAALLLAGAGAAVGAGLAGAIGVAATFEKQMSGVRAVMSPNEVKQFGSALDDLALKLGADTTFSAQQAASGIEELIKAGVPAKAVLEGAGKAALDLAAATGTDVATAATIAAQAMNAFKIPVSQLPTIVDRLAGVVNVSAADMGDLRFGLQAAGAVAATVGLSFEDTAAALGIFANNGLRGQDAGTSLKTMLINLVPNTKQQTEAFKRLGLITADGSNAFFDAQGHVKSLAQVSGVLQNALKGMTDQQKLAALQVLFGTDAMRAAAILAKTGAEGVNEFTDQVKQVSAADQAAERLNNFLGRLEQLGGSLQTVQIIIGRFFTPALGAVADTVKTVLNAFSDMSPQAKALVTAFVSVGGAIAAGIGGLVLLAPVVATIGPAFGFLGAALASLAPVMLAVGAAAAVLFAAWQANLFGIRQLVQRAFDALPGILDRVGKAFAQAGPFWENTILPAIQTIGNAVERSLIPVFNDVLPVVQDLSNRLAPILGNLGIVFQKVFSGDIGGALDTFKALIIAALPGAAGFVDLVGRVAEGVGRFAGNIGDGLLTFFTVTLPPILDTIGQFKDDVGTALLAFFNDRVLPIADAAGQFAGDVGAGLTTFFTVTLPPILDQIGRFAGDVGGAMLAWFRDDLPVIAGAAATFAGDIGAGLTTFFTVTLPPILDQIGKFTGDAVAPIIAFFRDNMPIVLDTVGKFAGDVGAGMVKFFTVDLPPILAQAGTVTQDTFAGLVDFFQNKGPIILEGAAKFTGAQVQPLTDFFSQFDAVKTQVQSLQPLFTAIGEFATALNDLSNAVDVITGRAIGSALKPELEFIGNSIKTLADTAGPAQPALLAIGNTVQTVGQQLQGVTDFFHNAAVAIEEFVTALGKVPDSKLPGAGGAGGFGLNPDLFNGKADLTNPSTEIFRHTAFSPGAAGGSGGQVVVQFNAPVNIDGAGGLEAFLDEMSARILAASKRGSPAVDNSGIPALKPTFA